MRYIILIFSLSMLFPTANFAQEQVEIPNVITPNGDSINDVFSIRASGFETLTCTIINRHGATVYRYFGLNGTWDGYTHAGVKVVAGTYFVLIELEREDGTVETRQSTLQVQY